MAKKQPKAAAPDDGKPKPTAEQLAASRIHTLEHIARVRDLLGDVIKELLDRGENHDFTKLNSPEIEYFAAYTDRLALSTFNSPEFNATKLLMKPALDHHYANHRHHPEHFKNGVEDMNILDVLEMALDWKASSELQLNGNLLQSIEANSKRFGIDAQLRKILDNTAEFFDRG